MLRLRPIIILLIQSKNLFFKSDVSLEIKRRITLANRCYYSLNGQFSNRYLFRTTKLMLYKTLILPVLLYCAEAWTLLSTDAAALRIFERIVLRKIICPVWVGDDFRIRFNNKMYELFNDLALCSVLIFSGCAVSAMSPPVKTVEISIEE